MLVLSRKCQQAVVVGGTDGGDPVVTVRVLEIKGQVVRLGFEAGASIPVHRWEVWQRMREGPAGGVAVMDE